MDFSQLEIFLSIAEEKSFSRAAEKMLRTQPAISIAMKRLEEELGETLFDRSSKNGSLTEAGRILLSYAQRMINLRNESINAVSELRGMFRGRLTIGANESTSLYLLPPLLMEYRKRFPNIKIEVFRAVSEKIPLEVSERNLDFGFLSYDPMHPNLQSLEIHKDELALVVPPNHRLAKHKQLAAAGRDQAEQRLSQFQDAYRQYAQQAEQQARQRHVDQAFRHIDQVEQLAHPGGLTRKSSGCGPQDAMCKAYPRTSHPIVHSAHAQPPFMAKAPR